MLLFSLVSTIRHDPLTSSFFLLNRRKLTIFQSLCNSLHDQLLSFRSTTMTIPSSAASHDFNACVGLSPWAITIPTLSLLLLNSVMASPTRRYYLLNSLLELRFFNTSIRFKIPVEQKYLIACLCYASAPSRLPAQSQDNDRPNNVDTR